MTNQEKKEIIFDVMESISKDAVNEVEYDFMFGYFVSFASRHLPDTAIEELQHRLNFRKEVRNEINEKNS